MPRIPVEHPKFLRPFFTYFGGKWRIAPKYPKPVYRKIIESHAGSAGYSLRYYWNDVWLCDVDPIVVGIWDYLIRSSRREILDLPDIEPTRSVDDFDIPQEAKWLVGFWLNKGQTSPGKSPSAWLRRGGWSECSVWGKPIRERIATQQPYIRHWKVRLCGYESIENTRATWFVDPPYEVAGKEYRFCKTNYPHLADWCKERSGQIIVCENDGAKWLPFSYLASAKANNSRGLARQTHEAIWTNES